MQTTCRLFSKAIFVQMTPDTTFKSSTHFLASLWMSNSQTIVAYGTLAHLKFIELLVLGLHYIQIEAKFIVFPIDR